MCVGPTDSTLGDHAKCDVGYGACKHTHVFKQLLLRPALLSTFPCFAFHGCVLNEVRAMAKRHMLPLAPVVDINKLCRLLLKQLVTVLPPTHLTPYTREQVIKELPPSKRRVAQRGFELLDDRGYGKWATRVSAFIKFEPGEYDFNEPPETKAPRLIQHRHPAYCYTLAQYLRPLEHYIFGRFRGHRTSRPWTTKGMNSWQIGQRISKMDRWAKTAFIELDHSRFDSCLRAELRIMEHKYYNMFYNDPLLRDLLREQINNVGLTHGGVSYKVRGTMMSGEYNTSLGDSIINYAVLRLFAGDEADIVVNGDDSVVAVPTHRLASLNWDIFKQVGFTTKYDVKFDIRDVSYCQCHPIRVERNGALHWRMVRDPSRVLSRTSYTIKKFDTHSKYVELANAKACGELSCNTGVPVLQAYAARVRTCNPRFNHQMLEAYMVENRRMDRLNFKEFPIHYQTRCDFAYAFGVDVSDQLLIERYLATAPLQCVL